MQLASLVELVGQVRATSKKTEKVRLLAEFLRQTQGRETELAAFYLSGSLPQGRIGVGWKMIEAAMTDNPPVEAPLTLLEVDQMFQDIAAIQGTGSADKKAKGMRRLIERSSTQERSFLCGLLMGEIRQGAEEGLILDAVAKAANLLPSTVRQAMMFSGKLGVVARAALELGAAGLSQFTMRLLTPVSPMLANSSEDISEALERLGEAVFEYKLDGARIQVHRCGEDVGVFTRQLQDVTERLPEVVEWVRGLAVRDVVLEGEALSLRPDGRPYPFQVTMRRLGRTKDIDSIRKKLPLASFFFDCLYVEGEGPLLSSPYQQRMEVLSRILPGSSLVPHIVTRDTAEAERFLHQALEAGHEGAMAKSLLAPYVAGQRGSHWLKIKAATTLDLVILAAEWGHGRRSGWLSNLHLGARDVDSGQFVMLGKTFKGLTDEMLRWQTEKLLSMEVGRDEWTVFVRPELVVEIAFGEIQDSPRYPAALALRFARVKRYRLDKPANEADTLQTVRALFESRSAWPAES